MRSGRRVHTGTHLDRSMMKYVFVFLHWFTHRWIHEHSERGLIQNELESTNYCMCRTHKQFWVLGQQFETKAQKFGFSCGVSEFPAQARSSSALNSLCQRHLCSGPIHRTSYQKISDSYMRLIVCLTSCFVSQVNAEDIAKEKRCTVMWISWKYNQ